MENKLFYTIALIVLSLVAFTTSPAIAQTTANGSYYATPSWDQTLPASTRFIVLSNMGSAAVLDRETGLVWERTPVAGNVTWISGIQHCRQLVIGNRKGWRLPSLEELESLLDGTQSNPALPSGHPFQGIGATDSFWSATSTEHDSLLAWIVDMGSIGNSGWSTKTAAFDRVWCVRGGASVSNPPY